MELVLKITKSHIRIYQTRDRKIDSIRYQQKRWVAKSIIVKRDDNSFIVPKWTQLLTQEEWYQKRTRAKLAREEFYQEMEDFGYDQSDFF